MIEKYPIAIDSYFEFGCAPGSVMSFFANRYGCRVEGLDFTDSARIIEVLDATITHPYQIYQDDVFNSTMKRLKIDNIPNRFMSPYIVVLAKKRKKIKSLEL